MAQQPELVPGHTGEWVTAAEQGEDGDDQEIVIAFSTEDQVEPPGEHVDLTDVDELPSHVAVS
jgi:hypothetical protein